MGPHPTVAAIRLAVRRVLHDVLTASAAPQPLVLAACSGGADSMALAAALAFEAPRLGVRAGAVTVDHGLQDGSAGRAREVADRLLALGLDPVDTVGVTVVRQSTRPRTARLHRRRRAPGRPRGRGPRRALRRARRHRRAARRRGRPARPYA